MKKSNRIDCHIIGGTGYGAGELMRLILLHPHLRLGQVISDSMADQTIETAHPQLKVNQKFLGQLNYKKITPDSVIFLALPHGVSIQQVQKIKSLTDAKIIDLSGDLRIKDQKIHTKFYPETAYESDLRKSFVYGLSELNTSQIAKANYISNPGCYATAAILAMAPIRNLEFKGRIVIDGKSGTSGGGRGLNQKFHHPSMNNNCSAYKVLDHRHEPEIALGLHPHGKLLNLQFVPHLLPISRGMLVSIYAELKTELSLKQLKSKYQNFYANSYFVRLKDEPAEIRNVIASNYCDLSIHCRGKQIVVTAAIDNLVKGMAGQAIQNLNLMMKWAEQTGLDQSGIGII